MNFAIALEYRVNLKEMEKRKVKINRETNVRDVVLMTSAIGTVSDELKIQIGM